MNETLARAAYALLLRLALPAYFARLWWRGRHEPAYRLHWAERLGHAPRPVHTGRLWLHAVSLGETHAAAPLIEALRAQHPGLRLLLTHGTATGREAGAKLLREGDAQVWLPYDTPGAVRRFLQAHQPAVGVLMETEIWPALLAEGEACAVPLVLANARLSARSAGKGRRLRALLHPALARFTRVLAQTEADAQRLRNAGARGVAVMGNLKFDLAPDAHLLARGHHWRHSMTRPVVLAASTREGEEAPLLRAWAALPVPRPLLLLVPRHPQRFDEVAEGVIAAGFNMQRRSTLAEPPAADAAKADVWLGDSLGEMALYYALADLALLGGSFEPLGGQNLIEAAACGCPLLMGPHTFNFALAAELSLAAGAAERVADINTAVQRATALVHDAAAKAAMSANARGFAEEHRGAAERMAHAVLALLPG